MTGQADLEANLAQAESAMDAAGSLLTTIVSVAQGLQSTATGLQQTVASLQASATNGATVDAALEADSQALATHLTALNTSVQLAQAALAKFPSPTSTTPATNSGESQATNAANSTPSS